MERREFLTGLLKGTAVAVVPSALLPATHEFYDIRLKTAAPCHIRYNEQFAVDVVDYEHHDLLMVDGTPAWVVSDGTAWVLIISDKTPKKGTAQ